MLKFYYDPKYKYTNRTIIDLTGDSNYREVNYLNIDTPDTINGHIIYTFGKNETTLPTYIYDTETTQRWFVSGITPVSSRKKYQISLLRDIISENPVTWANEPYAYIAAGLATNYNKYKRWDLPYTNTKIDQQKLTINGVSSFFVFYVNEQTIASDGAISESDLEVKYTLIPGINTYDYSVNGLNSIPSYEYVGAGQLTLLDNVNSKAYIQMRSGDALNSSFIKVGYGTTITSSTPGLSYETADMNGTTNLIKIDASSNAMYFNNANSSRDSLITALTNYGNTITTSEFGNSVISQTAVNNLSAYVNKIILDTSTNKIYTIRRTTGTRRRRNIYKNGTQASTLVSALSSINWPYFNSSNPDNYTSNGDFYEYQVDYYNYEYTLEQIGVANSLDFVLKANVRKLPKSAVRCVNIVPDNNFSAEELSQALMMVQTNASIDAENPNIGRILDIQYLPFSIAVNTNANIKINNTSLTAAFLEFDDYQYNINLTDLTDMHKETDTIKIVSPSRASQYLFRPYDNDGNMEFSAKITLKPYSSTIYVRPSTKGLLMYEWDDKDCLIIQEDFSLTKVTSQWTEYIYQNKTFLNSFERQIQGREFERGWERRVEEAQKASDEWTARNISSQKAQTYTGNIPIISGIAGAIGAAVPDRDYLTAARIDREYNEAMYQESVNISRDLFNYQMENIKSQPMVPSKITTIDCKFLDGIYLEFYSTNPTELEAIANYYANNGNRIDDYGTFASYWNSFVRGRLIRSNNYTQPEINELNRRLENGVFTGGITV